MMVSKRNLLFQLPLFRFHVKFQGCRGPLGSWKFRTWNRLVLRDELLVSWRVYSLPRWRTTCFVSFTARCYAIFLRSVETLGIALLGGGNSNIFYVHPENWGRFPFWRSYFSKGLVQPPTRLLLLIGFWKLEVMYVLELTERVLMKSVKMMINRSVPLFWAIVGGLDYAPSFGGGNQRWNGEPSIWSTWDHR